MLYGKGMRALSALIVGDKSVQDFLEGLVTLGSIPLSPLLVIHKFDGVGLPEADCEPISKGGSKEVKPTSASGLDASAASNRSSVERSPTAASPSLKSSRLTLSCNDVGK